MYKLEDIGWLVETLLMNLEIEITEQADSFRGKRTIKFKKKESK